MDISTHPCPLCDAAEEWDGEESTLKPTSKHYGVTPRLVKRRLELVTTTRTVWDDIRIQQFGDLIDEGLSLEAIAERFNISVTRVKQVIAAYDIDTTKGDAIRASNEVERASEVSTAVLTEYRDDPTRTPEMIAEALNEGPLELDVTATTVRRLLTSLGMPVKPKPRATAKKTAKAPAKKAPAKKTAAKKAIEPQIEDVPTAKFVAEYLESDEEPTLEGYVEWAAETEGAPTSTQVRKEFGSWARAKKAAEPFLA